MRVIHYSSSLSRTAGGLFFSVSGLAKAQQGHGIDVEVIGGADAQFEEDCSQWGTLPVHSHQLRFRYGFDPRVIAQIRRLKPDVFHVHGIWAAGSIYGRAAAEIGIPVVVSPRGMLDPWILARRPATKAIHGMLFERPLLRRSHVHALNESERAAVARYMPEAAARTFVLPNGVPSAPEAASATQRAGALFLGRLHSKKQTLELIAKWREIGSPDGERLTIAGWGDADYEAAVRSAAADAPSVEFVGPLHRAAKATALSRAKWFILPSLSEGLPMAVLEAIQHGCIPLITDQCNLPELFQDDIALRIETDFSDFAEVLRIARGLPDEEARRRSSAARSYAARYSWNAIAEAMQHQYESIILPRPAR